MLTNEETQHVYDIISPMAAWCHDDYRDELIQFAVVAVALEEADIATAYANAVRHVATAQRYARNTISLDQQIETFGDSLRAQAMEVPEINPSTARSDRHRAGDKATKRVKPCSANALNLEDQSLFRTVLMYIKQRGIFPTVEDLGIDISLRPKRERQLLRLILSLFTKRDLRRKGYEDDEISTAYAFLANYYAPT